MGKSIIETNSINQDSASPITHGKNNINQLLDVDQLASFMNVPKSKIYSMSRQNGEGSIPRYKIGRYVRFDIVEIIAWLKEKRKNGGG